MADNSILSELQEVRTEISRVNQAAGHTVFNPAATQALESAMERIGKLEGLLGIVRPDRK